MFTDVTSFGGYAFRFPYVGISSYKPETVADMGGAKGAMLPPGPVTISHKKDGRLRRLH